MPQAIAYARYSPRPDNSDSCDVQLAEIRVWARDHGIGIRAEFRDDQISGGLEPDEVKRAGIWSALNTLRRGEILLVRDLSRLARNAIVAASIERAVKSLGASIRSLRGQGTESDSPQDRLMRRIHEAFAEYEREMIRSITSAKMRLHQRSGRSMSSIPPFGYRIERKEDGQARLLTVREEQLALEYVSRLAKEGLSPYYIARRLNQEGVPCRNGRWHHSTIYRILKRLDK